MQITNKFRYSAIRHFYKEITGPFTQNHYSYKERLIILCCFYKSLPVSQPMLIYFDDGVRLVFIMVILSTLN